MKLSKDLGIPFYDKEIIEMAAQTSSIERSFFENY
ncbi:MAG: cytidylate kinase-like family protein, partial [Lachnospiraceae bacterium]|nr:cytidylate kinase-like family protein [Lachnospiraceae bacterium]